MASTLAAAAAGPLELTVERQAGQDGGPQTQTLTVTVPPNYAKRIGLVMTAGAISGVRPGSPAARGVPRRRCAGFPRRRTAG